MIGPSGSYRGARIDWEEQSGILDLFIERHPGNGRLNDNIHAMCRFVSGLRAETEKGGGVSYSASLNLSVWFMRAKSRQTPPNGAAKLPSRLEPPEKGTERLIQQPSSHRGATSDSKIRTHRNAISMTDPDDPRNFIGRLGIYHGSW